MLSLRLPASFIKVAKKPRFFSTFCVHPRLFVCFVDPLPIDASDYRIQSPSSSTGGKTGHQRSERHADSSRLLITGLLVRFQRGASPSSRRSYKEKRRAKNGLIFRGIPTGYPLLEFRPHATSISCRQPRIRMSFQLQPDIHRPVFITQTKCHLSLGGRLFSRRARCQALQWPGVVS
jgi:hypothetical protein